jgi:hypothetical protein
MLFYQYHPIGCNHPRNCRFNTLAPVVLIGTYLYKNFCKEILSSSLVKLPVI